VNAPRRGPSDGGVQCGEIALLERFSMAPAVWAAASVISGVVTAAPTRPRDEHAAWTARSGATIGPETGLAPTRAKPVSPGVTTTSVHSARSRSMTNAVVGATERGCRETIT
jgi:hypothetical protein